MAKLSILIPSRNEEWLVETVKDLLRNIEADTEILVGLDGAWAEPGLDDNDRVKILYVPEAIGQRALQNRLAIMSTAKYVMKVDAHCAFDKGFDRKMIEAFKETGDDVTMVPVMRNLWIFDWKCMNCGLRMYQGPEPIKCPVETCYDDPPNFKKKLVWNPKTNPQSSAYRFNKNLHFKYFPELRNTLPRTGLQETMSLQGSCFMATRKNYWEKELCDESWGNWGQQGSEVAIKTWLSGGRVLCNMDTWYGHLFRTQDGFDHPFELGGSQGRARKICQDVFYNNKWPKQKRPLSWLVEKFWPQLQQVGDPENWTQEDLEIIKNQAGNLRYKDGIIQ